MKVLEDFSKNSHKKFLKWGAGQSPAQTVDQINSFRQFAESFG